MLDNRYSVAFTTLPYTWENNKLNNVKQFNFNKTIVFIYDLNEK